MNQLIRLSIFLLLLTWTTTLKAQIVNIPDSSFKAALVAETTINTNQDTEIQVSEAQAFTGTIDVRSKGVADLTGIEAFTALTNLYCSYNQLTAINLSANTTLQTLYCGYNPLTTLDVSANTALTLLNCDNSQLTSLDVSGNTALQVLYCNRNQITNLNLNTTLLALRCEENQLTSLDVANIPTLTSIRCYQNQLTTIDVSNNSALTYINCPNNLLLDLDLSSNTALTFVNCQNNQLTSLNVKNGNNANMTFFYAEFNPNLTCIEVDDIAYSTANWTNIDTASSFSTDCNTSISTISGNMASVVAFPNPTSGRFLINFGEIYSSIDLEVCNLMGQVVFSKNYTALQYLELGIEGVSGLYLVKIRTKKGEVVLKIIKE